MSEHEIELEHTLASTGEPELGAEVPTEDALEQRAPAGDDDDAVGDDDGYVTGGPDESAVEADPADRAEQSRSVSMDEDDYR